MDDCEVMGAQADVEDGGGLASAATTPRIRCWCPVTCRPSSKQRGGLVLDNAEAALRTACLTGVATTKMSKE